MQIGYDAKRIFHNTTGLGNYSRDLVRIMAKFHPENHYFLYNPKPAKVHRLTPDHHVIREVLPQTFISKKLPSLWRSKWMVKQLIKDNIQVFHGLTGELPYGIDKTGIRTILTIHDLIFVRYPELYKAIDRKIYFKKFQYAARIADVVVAISEQTQRDIVSFLGIPPEKIRVIYQGCHRAFKEDFSPEFQNAILKKFNLPEEYILNVGAVNERKNLLTLVKAVAKTRDNLVVVGSGGAYFDTVKEYIARHQLSDKVFLLQKLSMEEIAVLYRHAKLFVYPSIFEGFGIPIIEALYSKTPVITSKGSCFPEAGGPDTLYLNDPHDVEALVKAIDKVKNDEKLRRDMIEKGFQYVQKFNDEHIAAQYKSLYGF